MGAQVLLQLPSSGEEKMFPPGLDTSSWGKSLTAPYWCSEEWGQPTKTIFLFESSEVLAPSDFSAQPQANTVPEGLKESPPLLTLLPTSCCQLQSAPCLPCSTVAEGIWKLWLTIAIRVSDIVTNQFYKACAAPFLTTLKSCRRQLSGNEGHNSHCF